MPAWLRDQLAVGAWILLAVVVVATVMTLLALLGVAVLTGGSMSSPGFAPGSSLTDYLAVCIQGLGLPLFGGLHVSAGVGSGQLFYVPALATAAVAAVTYRVSARRANAGGPGTAARDAAVAAAVPVLAVAVLTALIPVTVGPVRITTNHATLIALGFVLLFGVGFLARASRNPAAWGNARAWVRSPSAGRAWAGVSTHALLVAAMLTLVLFVWTLLDAGVVTTLGLLLLAPLAGGNALVVAAGLAHGGSVSAGGALGIIGSVQSASLFSSTTPRWALLLLLVPLVAALLAGIRMGLGMPDHDLGRWRDFWVTPVVFFVVWLLVLVTVGQASLRGDATGIPFLGTARGGLTLGVAPATALLFALWGCLAELSARLLSRPVHRRMPGIAAVLRVRPWGEQQPAPTAATTPIAPGTRPGAEAGHGSPGPAGTAGAVPAGAHAAPLAATTVPVRTLNDQQKQRLTFWGLLAGGLVVLAIVTVLVVRWLSAAFFGPGPLVEQYLAGLQAGDAESATALADPGVPNDLRAGLSNAVLGAAVARLDRIEVGEPTIHESSGSVPVQYSVDGERVSTMLTAERSGSTFLLFPTWRLTSSLAQSVTVNSTVGVAIGGTDVAQPPAGGSSGRDEVRTYLYPGRYSVSGAKGAATAKWLTPSTQSITVLSPAQRTGAVTLTTSASPALVDAVNGEVRRLVDSCASSGLASPRSPLGECPFSTYSSDGKATWKVISYPQMSVDVDSFSRTPRATTARPGSVQVTTSGAFSGPSTDTRSITVPSKRVVIGADGSIRLTG